MIDAERSAFQGCAALAAVALVLFLSGAVLGRCTAPDPAEPRDPAHAALDSAAARVQASERARSDSLRRSADAERAARDRAGLSPDSIPAATHRDRSRYEALSPDARARAADSALARRRGRPAD